MQDPMVFAAVQQQQQQPPQFPEQEQLRCPRCDSTNTKFCYYNNYNLSQPRHFCKSCRRYWTKGGTLRNVPVGGSSRKSSKRAGGAANKRPSHAASSVGPSGRGVDPKPEPGGVEGLGSMGLELLPAGSSFTSLLEAADGQLELGSFMGRIGPGQGNGLARGPVESVGGGGDRWPDLAIFTTSSSGFLQ